MEMSVDQAKQEYFSLFEKHVCPSFIAQCPKILQLLRTKGLRVFVPQNWKGIQGIPPIELRFSDDMPLVHKPKVRPVNQRIFEDTKKEYQRLSQYHLVPSDSPFASNLVVAPKATKPFVRLCGDHVFVNKFIIAGYFLIPHVPYVLEKIATYSIYIDLDLVNAFHQLPLAEETSRKLTILTPWGAARPKFLPEGVKPASEILQKIVHELFHDFSDWLIYQFDNLLILAHSYEDAYNKLDVLLSRCIERNVFLKFSKSFIGFTKVHFFGYDCQHSKYQLSQERKDGISKIPFPANLKQMQSFLGAALFFKSFVPHYSTKTAHLNDMIHKDFPWNKPSEWKEDYKKIFEDFKQALVNATANYYPNYELPWILRTDASNFGVGAVLLQVFNNPATNQVEYQPIAFASKKFSDAAQRWSTIEQEAYGIYFAVHHFTYYLRPKQFVIETDHNNLLWMEASLVPKVIRWRIYLQSFNFMIRHIAGKENTVADWLSRLNTISLQHVSPSQKLQKMALPPLISSPPITTVDPALRCTTDDMPDFRQVIDIFDDDKKKVPHERSLSTDIDDPYEKTKADLNEVTDDAADIAIDMEVDIGQITQTEMLHQVHNSRVGHFGIKVTHRRLNIAFPGHGISIRQIEDFISTCPTCQKDRLTMNTALKPVVRHIKPPHQRSAVGVDILSVSPADKFGHVCIIVIINHFTKFAALYPAMNHQAETLARALFLYFTTYGICEEIHSDPGSDLTSEVVEHLHSWFGITHVFSLVDRHQSNGVEGPNKQILRHLKALVFDERLTTTWGDEVNVAIIQYLLNTVDSSETGIVPIHAHFGSADATYHRMPLTRTDVQRTHAFVKLLDEQLQYLSDKSKQYQAALIDKRTSETPAERQNLYQPGDYVLIKMDAEGHRPPTKLSPRYFGPYEVIEQRKNDITCQHVVRHRIVKVHVERVKPFYGNAQAAHEAALRDYDEYDIVAINGYSGEPTKRKTLDFRVVYASGLTRWLPFAELSQNIFLDQYAKSRPELEPLLSDTAAHADKIMRNLRKEPITTVEPGDTVFVSLRSYGGEYYNTLPMEDRFDKDYVVEYEYTKWTNSSHTRITARCDIFNETFPDQDLCFVKFYGSERTFNVNTMILVTSQLIVQFPSLLPTNNSRPALLRKHRRIVEALQSR